MHTMAKAQVSGAVFQRTRDTLGKVINKPPLTDKLLGRPPFRFLHDIINEVTKQTRFFNGLYSSKEMDAKSIQERDDKVAFLQKAIDTLSFATGEVVKVRPSKIVSGQEPEKTNEFLQILGISVLKELDASEAVKRVKQGDKPSEVLTKEKKATKSDPGKERESKRSDSKERERKSRKPPSKGEASLKSKSHQSLKEGSQPEQRPTHRPSRTRPPLEQGAGPSDEIVTGDPPSPPVSVEDEGLGSETKLDRPVSAKGARRQIKAANSGSDSDGPPPESIPVPPETTSGSHVTSEATPPTQPPVMPLKRPGSARPAPPKIVQPATEDTTIASIVSGGVELSEGGSVIMDRPAADEGGASEDEEQFVVQDSAPLELPETEAFLPITHDKPEGALTKNIEAMKERLEGGGGGMEQKSTGSKQSSLSDAQRQREREMVTKEIEKLQASIQTLCKSANPLGKIMDYVQEDMDSMEKELNTWKVENEKHGQSLRKEESITDQELSPLRGLLKDLEAKLNEQMDLISTSKAAIVRNDERMQQMLISITLMS